VSEPQAKTCTREGERREGRRKGVKGERNNGRERQSDSKHARVGGGVRERDFKVEIQRGSVCVCMCARARDRFVERRDRSVERKG